LTPERRLYNKHREQSHAIVAVQSSWRGDVYIILGGVEDDLSVAGFKAMVNPLVGWIWLGGVAMALGGVVCLLPPLDPRTWRSRATACAPAGAKFKAPRPPRPSRRPRPARPAVSVS
jgi:cytochrome c biogenesis factor